MTYPTDSSVEAWKRYIDKLPPLGEQWIEACKKPGNPTVLSDTLGASLKPAAALTGSIVLARRIAKISPEQNIGLLLPTSAGGMLSNMAGMLLGKTVVNLNFTASLDALLSAIDQAEIKTVYTSSVFLEKLNARGMDTSALAKNTNLIMLEDFKISSVEKALTLLLCKILPAAILKNLFCKKHDLDAIAVILFSSGSEGDPKGVILSHRNLLTNIKQITKLLRIRDDDLILANLPLFHALGLTVTLFMPLLERVPVICHPDPADVYTNAKTIEKHRVSLMFGTSSFYRLYIRNNKVQSSMLDSLRLVIAGAEKLQKEVSAEFKAKFNKVIYEGYGVTETSPVASVNIPKNLHPIESEVSCKLGSVGLPLPGTRLKIVDPDSFVEFPIGTAGMVLISGGQVMQGYLNNQAKSEEVFHENDGLTWYTTGDKGYLDEDGFLFIEDRYSRFANIGGEMIGLGRVETAIKDVINDNELQIVAVNLPDSKKGEHIVVLSNQILDRTELREKLSQAGLNALALPTDYIKVDEIPCLGSGKTDFAQAKRLAAIYTETKQ